MRQPRRANITAAVLECLVEPAWKLTRYGAPDDPIYVVERNAGERVADFIAASAAIQSDIASYRFGTGPAGKRQAMVKLKELTAEHIVNALAAWL